MQIFTFYPHFHIPYSTYTSQVHLVFPPENSTMTNKQPKKKCDVFIECHCYQCFFIYKTVPHCTFVPFCYIFLLFFASKFFQTFFPRKLFFRQVMRMSVFLNSKCLTCRYLFVFLLLNIHLKHQIKK